MMDDSIFGFIGILVLFCGLYGIYAYVKMKKGGPINEALLLGKSYVEYKCKDREGFLAKALPAVLIFSITAVVYGVIDAIHCFVTPIAIADYIGMFLFLAVLVWYMVYTTKLKKEFFRS